MRDHRQASIEEERLREEQAERTELAPAGRSLFGVAFEIPVYAIVLAITIGTAFRAFDNTAGQALSCIVNSVLLIALLAQRPPTPEFWRRSLPVLALVAAGIVWAIMASLQPDWSLPDYSVGKILSLIAGVAALLSGAVIARGRTRRRALLDGLLLANSIILLLGLIVRQIGTDGYLSYWTVEREGRFMGLICNANVTAAVAGCYAVIAFARLTGLRRAPSWAGRRNALHLLYLPLFAVCLSVVVLTASRFTTVAVALILTVFALNWYFRRSGMTYRKWPSIAASLAVLIVVAGFSDLLISRFQALGAGYDDRVENWTHLLDVARQSPSWGYGLGSFSTVNARFLMSPRYAQAQWTLNSPHNVLLQLWLQAGWPYLLAIVGASVAGIVQVVAALKGRWTYDSAITVAVIALLVSCSMVDVVLDMPATVTLLLFLCGLLWGQALDAQKTLILFPAGDPADHVGAVAR